MSITMLDHLLDKFSDNEYSRPIASMNDDIPFAFEWRELFGVVVYEVSFPSSRSIFCELYILEAKAS